jgi:hypothetical protein
MTIFKTINTYIWILRENNFNVQRIDRVKFPIKKRSIDFSVRVTCVSSVEAEYDKQYNTCFDFRERPDSLLFSVLFSLSLVRREKYL